MNNFDELVPSLDLCRQLKAAGFPQDTALSWYPVTPAEERIDSEGNATGREPQEGAKTEFVFQSGECDDAICSAPTAEEILRELPWTLQPWLPNIHPVFLQVRQTPDGFRVAWLTWDNKHEVPCDDGDRHYEKGSEAVAHTYLWWKEHS